MESKLKILAIKRHFSHPIPMIAAAILKGAPNIPGDIATAEARRLWRGSHDVVGNVVAIADLLGLSVDWMLGRSEHQTLAHKDSK